MVANLPAVSRKEPGKALPINARYPFSSESKYIQRAHFRRIRTKKGKSLVAVNLGKQARAIVKTPPTRNQLSLPKPPLTLPPRTTWRDVLKPEVPDKEVLALETLKREMESEGISLEEGEVVFRKIVRFSRPHPMSVTGEVVVQEFGGGIAKIPFEFRSSRAGVIEAMQDFIQRGEKVIFKIEDDMGVMPYVDYVRPFKRAVLNPFTEGSGAKIMPAKSGGVVLESHIEGKPVKKKWFASWEAANDAYRRAAEQGKDVLGRSIFGQRRLKDFGKTS